MLLSLFIVLAGAMPSATTMPVNDGLHAHEAQVAVCPPDDARARANVDRFMTSSTFAADRQRLGIDGLAPSAVRVLQDVTDAGVCKSLNDAVQLATRPYPRLKMYYTVGAYYVVSTITVVPPDRVYPSFEPLHILDKSTLRPVMSFAM